MNFIEALNRGKTLIVDGDMKALLSTKGVSPDKCPEILNLERPDLIVDIHRKYIRAGASIISCHSSGCSRSSLARYRLEDFQERIITAAIFNGIKAAQTRALIAYSMGSTGQIEKDFNWYYNQFEKQAMIINKYPVDLIIIEAIPDLQEARAALLAVKENCLIPIVCTMAFQKTGKTPPDVAACVLSSLGADAVGISSNTAGEILEWMETFIENTDLPVMVRPDCKPSEQYVANPETYVSECKKLYISGAAVLGGGEGATPLHIEMFANTLKNMPVVRNKKNKDYVSVTSCTRIVKISTDQPFAAIGESISPSDNQTVVEELAKGELNIPLILNCKNPGALEKALRIYPGKALVNSIDLKPDTLNTLLPVIKKYGAAFIALPTDQDDAHSTAGEHL